MSFENFLNNKIKIQKNKNIDEFKSYLNSSSYNEKKYIGKSTDRIFATLTCERELSEEQQKLLIKKFNTFLNKERDKYNNLILTNYRDYGRKRISFDDVYKILTFLIDKT